MTPIQISPGHNTPPIRVEGEPGSKLSAAIWLSGQMPPQPLCNGLSRCGRCKVRFLENSPPPSEAESAYFSSAELIAGWRLGCRHRVPEAGPVLLEVPSPDGHQRKHSTDFTPDQLFLGIDFGTTSIEWQAVDKNGTTIAKGMQWNPQGGAGADVISRLQFALTEDGLKRLATLGRQAIIAIAGDVANQTAPVRRICIAANSAMTEILLEKNIHGLAASPYHLSFGGGCVADLPGLAPPILWPPLPAPFVGGDISAGLLPLIEANSPRPFLLVDMGTNGELALLKENNDLFLASVPLGPALEGIGPACGQPAAPGIITSFALGPQGLIPQFSQADGTCKGVSATGYISLLAILAKLGLMGEQGQFQASPMPLAQKIAPGVPSNRIQLPESLYIEANDVELLLKVKASLNLALRRIMAAANLSESALSGIYLAGALGQHIDLRALLSLGFLPQCWNSKIHTSGNTALAGACLLARNPGKLAGLAHLCQKAAVINLTEDPEFLADFIRYMVWKYL